jgi:hypothetical protein
MKKLLLTLLISLFFVPVVFGIEIEDRTFEIGFNAGLSISNDYLSIGDIFNDRRTIELDLNELKNGFKMNMGFLASPFFFNYNNKRGGWGFGLSTKFDALGIFNLSGKMLTFSETTGDKDDEISEISGAAFLEAAVPFHLLYNKFKIKIKPALFFPIVYATSDIKYIYDNTDVSKGTILYLGYDVQAYIPISADSKLTAKPGVDFYIGVDFPISEVLGLNKIPLLDFDVGLELFGIPLFAGVMQSYKEFKGSLGSEEKGIKLFDDDFDMDNFFDIDSDTIEGDDGSVKVRRPFKLLLHADWRPLEISMFKFIVTPSFGFAISPIYNKPFSMEAGVKTTLDIGNLFIFSLGTGYHDRLWKNGFDLTLNLRAVEFNFGLALCSPGFVKSWTGGGLAFNLGFKSGW